MKTNKYKILRFFCLVLFIELIVSTAGAIYIKAKEHSLFIKPIREFYNNTKDNDLLLKPVDKIDIFYTNQYNNGGSITRTYFSLYETDEPDIIGVDEFKYNGLQDYFPYILFPNSNESNYSVDEGIGFIKCSKYNLNLNKCKKLVKLLIENDVLSPSLSLDEINNSTIHEENYYEVLKEGENLIGISDDKLIVTKFKDSEIVSTSEFNTIREIITIDLNKLKILSTNELEKYTSIFQYKDEIYASNKVLYKYDFSSLKFKLLYEYPIEFIISNDEPNGELSSNYPSVKEFNNNLLLIFSRGGVLSGETIDRLVDLRTIFKAEDSFVDYSIIKDNLIIVSNKKISMYDETLNILNEVDLTPYVFDFKNLNFSIITNKYDQLGVVSINYYRENKELEVNLQNGSVTLIDR
jgi:hypothetical protein